MFSINTFIIICAVLINLYIATCLFLRFFADNSPLNIAECIGLFRITLKYAGRVFISMGLIFGAMTFCKYLGLW